MRQFISVFAGYGKTNLCTLIVAVGGGSTIDVAKCIKLFYGTENPLTYLTDRAGVDYGKINDINLVALPTTAGTGSESTKHAVIYYNDQKQSIGDSAIIPDIAILDSAVLRTLPLAQKKATMFDALCQGIESWWSVNSDDESKGYSKTAVETVISEYKAYIFDNDGQAAAKILYASNCAGRAINITQTTAAHAMSYKITSLYNLPHGHAVALCLPVVWEYMLDNISLCIDRRGQEYLRNIFNEIPIDVSGFKALMNELQMRSPTAAERDKEIDILTQSVNPVRLKNNPVYLSNEVLRDMYERIIK